MGLQGSSQASCLWLIRMNWESRPCAELWLLLHCSKMGLSYHHVSSSLPLIKTVCEVSTQSNSVSLRFDTTSSSTIVNQHLESVHPRTEESRKSRPGPALQCNCFLLASPRRLLMGMEGTAGINLNYAGHVNCSWLLKPCSPVIGHFPVKYYSCS